MGSARVNTFEIDFSVCGVRSRPPIAVVHLWIKENLKIPVEDVDGIQCDNENSKVFLKLASKEVYEKWEHLGGEYNFTDNKGKTWKIPVREVTQCTMVRVVGVTLETPMKPILEALNEYGEIQSSEFERYGHGYTFPVRNGVRLFKMVLKKPIPSYIRFEEKEENFCSAQVFYTGQTKTCKVCGSAAHFVRSCPRRRGNPKRQVSNYYKASEKEYPPLPEAGDTGDGDSSGSNEEQQPHTSAGEGESITSQTVIPSSQKMREKRQRVPSEEFSFASILQQKQPRKGPKKDGHGMTATENKMAGCYVFATEWAPCGDLAGAVAKAPGPSEAAVRGVAAQIGSALEFMHSKSLAHRDLKLENVLVFAPDLSRVKLADMGSTRRTGSLVAPVQTWRPFLPPEECGVLPKERYTCSVAGDTWQLAILVLVALSGAPPWRSADISDFDYCQFARWQKRRTTKLPAKFKAYTPRFLRLLRRMLEPKVDKRAPISDVQKYVSDSWLVVSRGVPQGGLAALQQGEDGSDSLLYLNSRGDQSKRGLAKLLSSYGLETTVDRQEMTRRLCEWVLSCDTSDDGSVTESV